MKILVVLLLLANVAYFGWHYNEQVRDKVVKSRSLAPLSAPSLKLIYELDQLPPLRERPDGTPQSGSGESPPEQQIDITTEISTEGDASNVCVNIGPFPSDDDLSELKAWFRPRAAMIQTQVETVRKRRLFWVYLEAESESAAEQSVADLKRKGVQDYLLIRHGGLKNAISLGLFSSQDSVNRRLAEMNRQGYKPVVVPRFETTDRYWLRAHLAKGYEDLSQVPHEILGSAELSEIRCSEIADPIASS